jgi:hypothetical protein
VSLFANQQVFIALVVAVSSMFGPVLVGWVAYYIRRKEKQEEYARQDEVARRVEIVKETTVAARAVMNNKLDEIHELVNSNMTSALLSERSALNGQLTLMYEIIALRRMSRQEPSAETLSTIEDIKTKLATLTDTLKSRHGTE